MILHNTAKILRDADFELEEVQLNDTANNIQPYRGKCVNVTNYIIKRKTYYNPKEWIQNLYNI